MLPYIRLEGGGTSEMINDCRHHGSAPAGEKNRCVHVCIWCRQLKLYHSSKIVQSGQKHPSFRRGPPDPAVHNTGPQSGSNKSDMEV